MTATTKAPRLDPETAAALNSLLEEEWREHRRLLRLAVRQNRYLRRQDVRRMEANAGEWRRYLPVAEAARKRRERFLRELGEERGLGAEESRLGRLAQTAEGQAGVGLRTCLEGWRRTAAELVRQNSLNGVLARFCLDLVGNEAELFRRGAGGDAGCYESDGARTANGNACVIEQRA